jgi:arylsulfatase
MKTFFALLLAVVLPHVICRAAPPPNIVVVFTDDQGYADVGCFGAKGYETPNLDRMAAEGVRFTDFHVSSAVCSASRAALLTGCYHARVGIHGALGPDSKHGLHTNEMTIAEVLSQKGYATGMAGKWHLGHLPQFLPVRQGFDEYFGLPYSNDMWPYHPEAKKGTYPPLPLIEGDQIIDPEITPEEQRNLTTWYVERTVKFIEKNKDQPFFFYLAHSMPHVPLYVSDKFQGKSKQGLYGDVIMEIDWGIGEILKALKQHGLDDNTLVIFTSDNGPWLSYGEHSGSAGSLREGKGTSWEGGTRVPLIARWPGRIPAGKVQEQPAMTIDLLPTFATLAGAPLPPLRIDGLDIWPLLACEKGARSPHPVYFTWYANNQLQAVRSGHWKLILPHHYRTLDNRPGGKDGIPAKYGAREVTEPELYNLESDPGESNNIAADNPAILRRLLAFAEQARGELGDSLTRRQGTGVRPAGNLSP